MVSDDDISEIIRWSWEWRRQEYLLCRCVVSSCVGGETAELSETVSELLLIWLIASVKCEMYSSDRGRTIQLMFSRAPGLEPCQPVESMYSAEDLSVSTPGWHWCYYTTVYCAAVDVVTTTVTTLTAPRLHRENCGQVLLVPVLVVVVYSRMDLDDVERLTFLWFSNKKVQVNVTNL